MRTLRLVRDDAAGPGRGTDVRLQAHSIHEARGVKNNGTVINHRNKLRTNERMANAQPFVHAKMFKHWCIDCVAKHERNASIDVMMHAESPIEGMLFLIGVPNLQNLLKLAVGGDVGLAPRCDLTLWLSAHAVRKTAIADCDACGDYVRRDLFRPIMMPVKEHTYRLHAQLDLTDKLGVANYRQSRLSHND
jgi:bacterioferritin